MSLQSDNCNDITNSLLCTPIIWNHSEKNWNGISLRVVSEKITSGFLRIFGFRP